MYMASQRREYILRQLEELGQIRSIELARELKVTDETIRTDLVQMEKQGLLQRVHGGARYCLPQQEGADARLASQLSAVARKQLDGQKSIYLEDSLMARAFVAQLGDYDCELIVNSPALALHLSAKRITQKVRVLGGELDRESGHILGYETYTQFSQLSPELSILSPESISPDGLGYEHLQQATWIQASQRHSGQVWILAAASKLRAKARYESHLTRPIDLLITEDNWPSNWPEEDQFESIIDVPYITAPE